MNTTKASPFHCNCDIVGTSAYCPLHRSTSPCAKDTFPADSNNFTPLYIRPFGHTGRCSNSPLIADKLKEQQTEFFDFVEGKPGHVVNGAIVEQFKNEVYQVLVRKARLHSRTGPLSHNEMKELIAMIDERVELCFDETMFKTKE